MKIFDKLLDGWRNGSSTLFLTEQDGKDLIIAYYHRFSDKEIEVVVEKKIVEKIEELAKKQLHNKVMKKYIDKKANEIFNKFLSQ